jgi:hypothetical protein
MGGAPMPASFARQVTLLGRLLDERRAVVEALERNLLNVRGKDTLRRRDRTHFETLLSQSIFRHGGVEADGPQLSRDLEARRLADGFEPVAVDRFHHDLDPLDLVIRAYEWWEATRWPGASGRLAYARTIFSAWMIRRLELLTLRLWDDGDELAPARLHDVQVLLDRLHEPGDAPRFARGAAWLLQTAQGPLTRHLLPYFRIADQIGRSAVDDADRLEIHAAGAKLIGGHLRSQLHYQMWTTNRGADDPAVLATTRNSNSLDTALLVRDLRALLTAYDGACAENDPTPRRALADAILQGLSADPDLLVARLDLLGPATAIETVFETRDRDGHPHLTTLGETHRAAVAQYVEQLGCAASHLLGDLGALADARQVYSPFAITYGFCADLFSNIGMDALAAPSSGAWAVEDLFDGTGRHSEATAARAKRFERLPMRTGERPHFDYASQLAAGVVDRLAEALAARAHRPHDLNASGRRTGRLLIRPAAESAAAASAGTVPPAVAADEHCFTTEADPVGAITPWPAPQLLIDRDEGRYLASVEVGKTWFAVSKVILTLILGQGQDAVLPSLPDAVVQALRFSCAAIIDRDSA